MNEAISFILSSPVAPFLKKIILYGSFARGKERYDSDIDLLLVLADEAPYEDDFKRKKRHLRTEMDDLSCPVDIHYMNLSEYEKEDPWTQVQGWALRQKFLNVLREAPARSLR